MEQLAKQMLRFVSYRAASSSSGSVNEFTHKIPTDRLLQPRTPLNWASSKDLEDGITRAMEEVALANGALANEVCFCNELLYHSLNQRTGMEKANERRMANKTTGLRPEHKYLIWFVNLTPTPTTIDDASSGSHWCVILVDFTRGNGILGHGQSLRVSEVHNTPSIYRNVLNVYARVRFFDPMGGSMPYAVRETLRHLLRDQLVGNLMRLNVNYAFKLTDQTRIDLELFWYNMGEPGSDSGVAGGWRLQTGDGVQCGIWCIWFVHQFMLHGILQLHLWALPPNPTNQVANQLSFRRWYFVKSTEKQPTHEDGHRRKRVRPKADGASSRQAIEVHSSDDDREAHPAAAASAADHAIEVHSSEDDEWAPKKNMRPMRRYFVKSTEKQTTHEDGHRRKSVRPKADGASSRQAIEVHSSDDDDEAHPAAAASAADRAIEGHSSEDDELAPKKKMRPMRRAPAAAASAAAEAIDLQSSEDDDLAPKKKMRPMRHAPETAASAPDHTQADGLSSEASKPRRPNKRHSFKYD